jgi:hypothetical protein
MVNAPSRPSNRGIRTACRNLDPPTLDPCGPFQLSTFQRHAQRDIHKLGDSLTLHHIPIRLHLMRNLHIYLSALTFLDSALGIRHGASQLRDLQAFPKFEVQFLNHLPVTESDAARMQRDGLQHDDEWSDVHRQRASDRHRLDAGLVDESHNVSLQGPGQSDIDS